MVGRVPTRFDGGIDHVGGGREIGFAGPESNHRFPRRLQRLRFGVDGQGRGLGNGANTSGNSLVLAHPAIVTRGRGRGRTDSGQRTAIRAEPATSLSDA